MNNVNWNAEDYESHSHAQQLWARELIAKLKFEGTEDVLDLGDGKVTSEIATAVPQGSVVGVDSSTAMIELATRRYPPANHANPSFHHMDATARRFEQNFDVGSQMQRCTG